MFYRLTHVLFCMLFCVTVYAQQDDYFCQTYNSLLTSCNTCKTNNTCTTVDHAHCSKLTTYKQKCETEKQQPQEAPVEIEEKPYSSTHGDSTQESNTTSSSPFDRKTPSLDNNVDVITPNKPVPATGMKNKPATPSTKQLKKPSTDFIMKSWY